MSLLLEHVDKSFCPLRAIANLSLEVAARALFGFPDPNRAGKTTTMRISGRSGRIFARS
jgi:ABC-type uncharacterized transport system ATPase subunit